MRAKTGCIQCRKVKKKCDESKPICQRCFKKEIGCSFLELNSYGISESSKKYSPTMPYLSISLQPLTPQPITSCTFQNPSLSNDLIIKPSPYFQKYNLLDKLGAVSKSIETANLQMFLINTFFNNVIETLTPKRSLKLISDITFDSITESPYVRDTITALSTAFIFNVDTSNQLVLKHDNFRKEIAIEDKLHSIIFTILISLYTDIKNETTINNIQYAIELASNFNPLEPSKKFKVIVESIIYNFSVSIITSPANSTIKNPFEILQKWRNLYPTSPDLNSNPLLGHSLESYILIAKVSYIFKYPNLLDEYYSNLVQQIDQLLKLQPMNFSQTKMTIPIYISTYINLLSLKLLLYHLKDQKTTMSYKSAIDNMLFIIRYTMYDANNELELSGQWGIFMLGLNLTNKEDQLMLTKCFQNCWKKTKNIGFLKALKKFEYAWTKNIGFDILKNESFTSDLCLH